MTHRFWTALRSWRDAAINFVRHILFLGLIVWLGLIMVIWNLLSLPLLLIPPPWRPTRWGQMMVMIAGRLFLGTMHFTGVARFDLRDLDRLRGDGALIIAPNHPTMLDVLLIASRLPRIVCVGKGALWRHPLLGPGMRLAGFLRNDTPVELVRHASAKLRAGEDQLLLFPEGTRTVLPPIGPLRGGFALIAKRAGVPVQTVLLHSNSAFLGKAWPFFKRPDYPLVYRAELGRRFMVEGTVKEFLPMIEGYYRRELAPGTAPVPAEA